MTFRQRLILLIAIVVAIVIAAVSGVTWLFARDTLRGEVDSSLRQASHQIAVPTNGDFGSETFTVPHTLLGGAVVYAQVINTNGEIMRSKDAHGEIPVTTRARDVAAGKHKAYYSDRTIRRAHVRVYTSYVGPGLALQTARSLVETDQSLRHLALSLIVVTLIGIFIAAALAWFVARAALRPVTKLTHEAERLAGSRDLTERMDAAGQDELSRLARTLNSMLDEVEDAVMSQRQLVGDASHELRTPLTSVRTNVEVLMHSLDSLPPSDRQSMLTDVLAQLHELTTLVNDLVDLARGNEPETTREPLRLDELVADAVERAHMLHPTVRFVTDLRECLVLGSPDLLHRAVGNLIENAAKWTPDGEPVEVSVADGMVRVRDHGPGFDPADIPHVFERFYRAKAARGKPGSGLGLAIVRQVADAHEGAVEAANAPGGGAAMRLELAVLDDE